MFVIEVKTKGGSKYLIYRRYRSFFSLHQELEQKFSPDRQSGTYTCTLPTLPGKVFMGNKQEIAESRIPELNTYMKGLLSLPTWALLDDLIRMFFYQTESDSQQVPRNLRRLRPPTRRVKTIKPKMDLFSSPRAEVRGRKEWRERGEEAQGEGKGGVGGREGGIGVGMGGGRGGRRVRGVTGIFPQSFVKVIKPLPDDSDEEEAGGGRGGYSCLRCYLQENNETQLRDVCVEEDMSIQPSYKDLLKRMREVFNRDDISLNYRDPEGDLVRILDDLDVALMVEESKIQDGVKRPVNQYPWELHVTPTSDLSVYNNAP
ncbi:NCF4 factor, partial [Amia calva]|nr:NCF4 factor [Amia calva]